MTKEQEQLKDRIGEYLIPRIDQGFLFDELSDKYLEKAGVLHILKDVPVPIRISDMSGMTTVTIARNMAYVMGCDINFRYRQNYIDYIVHTFSKDFVKPLINEGVELAASEKYEEACILFRAALMIDTENRDALYCYGRACKDAYENGSGEEYIGRFKAESLEAFERLTLQDPDFDMGFYFLGFGYVNLGLYIKAKLTWDRFMELSSQGELRAEVRGLLDKLDEPCKIEEGYNAVLSGRFEEGIAILSDYEEDSRFNTWWPLWYYLGMAYKGLEEYQDAEERFRRVLQYSPSNVDTMKELAEIYEIWGDTEKVEKYRNKIKIVNANAELDREEKRAQEMPGLS